MRNRLLSGLLDDCSAPLGPADGEWLELTRASFSTGARKPVRRSADPAAPAIKRAKIFRSRKTLRQMVEEYNGRHSSLQPLKSSLASSALVPSAAKPVSQPMRAQPKDFRYDRVEVMEVPPLPGRILRPKS